jgi:hypothetical protein
MPWWWRREAQISRIFGVLFRAPVNDRALLTAGFLEDREIQCEYFVWPHRLQKKVMIIISILFYKQFLASHQWRWLFVLLSANQGKFAKL